MEYLGVAFHSPQRVESRVLQMVKKVSGVDFAMGIAEAFKQLMKGSSIGYGPTVAGYGPSVLTIHEILRRLGRFLVGSKTGSQTHEIVQRRTGVATPSLVTLERSDLH